LQFQAVFRLQFTNFLVHIRKETLNLPLKCIENLQTLHQILHNYADSEQVAMPLQPISFPDGLKCVQRQGEVAADGVLVLNVADEA
jgi:hypothetical protein